MLLVAGEEEREHHARDRDVENDGAPHGVDQRRSPVGRDEYQEESSATARTFDWIVKKLQKLPFA
jgi:hypothetical protein